jgi:hypothetical protein
MTQLTFASQAGLEKYGRKSCPTTQIKETTKRFQLQSRFSANCARANQTGFYLDGSSMRRKTHRDSEVLPA